MSGFGTTNARSTLDNQSEGEVPGADHLTDPLGTDPLSSGPTTTVGNAITDRADSQRTDDSWGKQRRAKARVEGDHFRMGLLRGAGWDEHPQSAKTAVGKRFPAGGLLTDGERLAILNMTDKAGVKWLHAAGLFTEDEAREYIKKGDFRDFHLLHRSQKIQLADMAWRMEAGGTPAYWVARSIMAKGKAVSAQDREALQEAMDGELAAAWAATLSQIDLDNDSKLAIQRGAVHDPTAKGKILGVDAVQERHSAATAILKKIFVVLQTGVQVYDKKGLMQDYDGPVAKLLSHGGRVNIRVPKLTDGESAHALTDWMGITEGGNAESTGAVFKRSFGTHHMKIGEDKDGQKGEFEEEGGKLAALKSKLDTTELYGMNLAVGGVGSRDFNGDVVLPDGAHGHLFLGFLPPTDKKDGALQVGVETTGPHAPSTVGYVHNWNSTEKTANPISSAGGLKEDKVGDNRVVDLNGLGSDWQGKLAEFEKTLEGISNQALVGRRWALKRQLHGIPDK